MQENNAYQESRAPRSLGEARGDGVTRRVQLWLGLALGVVLVVSGAGLAWRDARAEGEARLGAARAAARLLAASAASLIESQAGDKIPALAHRVAGTARLNDCNVTLNNGMVLGDAEGTTPPVEIPSGWTGTPREPGADRDPGTGAWVVVAPFEVPGRGGGYAEVSLAQESRAAWLSRTSMAWLAALTLLGLGAWYGVGRMVRSRTRALGAMQQALEAATRGVGDPQAMRLAGDFGVGAVAWNKILSELESLRTDALLEAGDADASQGGGDGQLVAACDAFWHGLLIVDEQMRVRYCNGAAAVLLRAKRDDLQGGDLRKATSNMELLSVIEGGATGRSRQRASVEVRADAPQGSRGVEGGTVIRCGVRPMRTDAGPWALVLLEDVTQQRAADESRNALVAQATHELRTPLTNIRLYVETLVESGESDPAVRGKCINVIGQEARRLERIVGDMLSVAEIEAGSLKLRAGDVRLDALFEDLRQDYAVQATDKEIALTIDLPAKLPVLQGDRDKVALTLHNLIGNAFKYTPAGGRVGVKVECDERTLTVSVSDNGIGIRPEEQELIFEKFYRAKDRRIGSISGSGLGLALARQVARMHGGDISVRSEIDKGSTFVLTLPIAGQGGVNLPAAA